MEGCVTIKKGVHTLIFVEEGQWLMVGGPEGGSATSATCSLSQLQQNQRRSFGQGQYLKLY